MKHWHKAFLSLVLTAAVAGVSLPMQGDVARAQTASGIPSGFSVMPVPNYDRSDDSILQINNLTIRGVNGNIIYASKADGVTCVSYQSAQGYGAPIACPQIMPNVLYQIAVQSDTILLLRNRARTNLATFTVGDRINVFGFVDNSSGYIQALIMRDLDKPVTGPVSQYVQLNNVTIISDPSTPYPPATFAVAESGHPCWYYSGPAGYRLSVSACPVPADQPASGVSLNSSFLPYPGARIYTVQVAGYTALLDVYRRPIALAELRMGDSVNIFGRYVPGSGLIDALIIRDLGTGVVTPGNGSAGVTVVDPAIQCITAPCGLVPNATVQIGSWSGITNNQGQAFIAGIKPGTYSVIATTPDGRKGTATITIASGVAQPVTVYLNRGPNTGSLQVLAPNGGEVLQRGSAYQIRWSIPSMSPGQYSAGNSFDVFLEQRTYGSDTAGSLRFTIARGVFMDFGMTSGSYLWTVGQNQENMNVADGGNYFIRVCYAGTLACDESDGAFSVGQGGTSTVQLYSINPVSGPSGSTVTLTGTGFTPANNVVNFGGAAYLPNLSASNNTTLSFTVPAHTSYPCEYTIPRCAQATSQIIPGTYAVWVENANGRSNQLSFTLQGGGSTGQVSVFGINPSSGYAGASVTLTGSGFTPSENIVRFEMNDSDTAYLPNLSSNGNSITFTAPSYSSYACQYTNPACSVMNKTLSPGTYRVWVQNQNGTSNQVSFTLQGGSTGQLALHSANPSSGYVGTWVTLNGTGFASNGNKIVFDGQYQTGNYSSNGTTLTFQMPDYVGAYCAPGQACIQLAYQLPAGQHAIAVENANGARSNSVNFQLYR